MTVDEQIKQLAEATKANQAALALLLARDVQQDFIKGTDLAPAALTRTALQIVDTVTLNIANGTRLLNRQVAFNRTPTAVHVKFIGQTAATSRMEFALLFEQLKFRGSSDVIGSFILMPKNYGNLATVVDPVTGAVTNLNFYVFEQWLPVAGQFWQVSQVSGSGTGALFQKIVDTISGNFAVYSPVLMTAFYP